MSRPPGQDRPQVVVVGTDRTDIAWLAGCLADTCDVTVVPGVEALRGALAARPRQVVVVTDALVDGAARDAVAALAHPAHGCALLLLNADLAGGPIRPERGGDPADAADFPPVFYRLSRALPGEQVRGLVASAARTIRAAALREPTGEADDEAEAARVQKVLDAARTFASQRELADAAAAAEAAVRNLAGADRGYCLFHDASDGALWWETDDDPPGDGARDAGAGDQARDASRGLAGYAVRTGAPVFVDHAASDPRFAESIDDPLGAGRPRSGARMSLAACPVADPDGTAHAVLVAVRDDLPFTDSERRSLVGLTEHLAPHIHQLALRVEAEAIIEAASAGRGASDPELFRREALEAYLSRGHRGDVVRVTPRWVRWAYWPLLALLVVGGAFLYFGRVDQYTVGPAVVQLAGRGDVSASAAGTVTAIEVSPGDRVRAGEVIARLHDVGEAAEVERLQAEFDDQLRSRMLDPGDLAADQAVRALRSQLELARVRLEQRIIRARRGGVVSDVSARVGEHLDPGARVASLVGEDSRLSLIALLPGKDRPQIEPGMALRFELSGYRYAYQHLVIHRVSEEVIGPAEARRHLGGRIADGISVLGPVVVVEALIPDDTFDADGEVYSYHDGMQGVAEVKLKSQRIVVALIPQLEKL